MLFWIPSKIQPNYRFLPVIMTRYGLSPDTTTCHNSVKSQGFFWEALFLEIRVEAFTIFFLLFALWYRSSSTQWQSYGTSRSATTHHMPAEFCDGAESLGFIRWGQQCSSGPNRSRFDYVKRGHWREVTWFGLCLKKMNYNKM